MGNLIVIEVIDLKVLVSWIWGFRRFIHGFVCIQGQIYKATIAKEMSDAVA